MFVELLSLVVEPALRAEGLGIRENRFVGVVNVAAVADNGLCIIVSRSLNIGVCVNHWCDIHTPGGIARPQKVAPEGGTTRGNLPGAP